MKNLRKVLAIVLVVALAFSMMAVASAKQIGDFSDASTVKYTEAVDLVSGLGIMTGAGGTTFDPTGTFTREQAAKVICYILLGSTISSNLATSTSSFKDVDATRWSAPYIEYCAANGIINGAGDGNFNPTAPVTGSAMAKLLLTALGYGAKGEYTGANWEINTLVKAQSLGILDTGVNYSAAATREQVAKYVFNVLTKITCYTVTYNPVLGTYVGNNASTSDADKFAAGLGALTFGLFKTDRDVYGLDQHQWTTTFQTVNVSGVYSDDKVVYTGTNGTTISDLTTLGNLSYKASLFTSYAVWENGSQTGTSTIPASANTSADKIGTVVKFMDNNTDGFVEKVVIVERTVLTLTAAPVVNADTTVTIAGIGTAAATRISYPAGLAKDDVVMVYTAGGALNGLGTMTYVEKLSSFTGTVTSITGGAYTIGGSVYAVAALAGVTGGSPVIGNTTATYWADSYKNIVKITGPVTVPNTYGMVLAYLYTDANAILGTTTSSKAQLLLADGTKKIFDLATASGLPTNDGLVPGQLVKFLANGTTINTLVTASTASSPIVHGVANPVSWTNKDTTVAIDSTNYYMTSSTVYFYYASATQYGVIVGNTNVPNTSIIDVTTTTTVNELSLVDFAKTSIGVLEAIVIPQAPSTAVTAPNYAYITSPVFTVTQELVNGIPTTIRSYNTIVNGTATTLKTTSTTDYAAGLYIVTTSNGYSSFASQTLEETAANVTVADAGYIVAGGHLYAITATTEIYQAAFNAFGVTTLTKATPAVPLVGTLKANVEATSGTATYIMFWYE